MVSTAWGGSAPKMTGQGLEKADLREQGLLPAPEWWLLR